MDQATAETAATGRSEELIVRCVEVMPVKSQSAPTKALTTVLVIFFVLFCFHVNCTLQRSADAQMIILKTPEFQKTVHFAICSQQIAVIVIIPVFVEQR